MPLKEFPIVSEVARPSNSIRLLERAARKKTAFIVSSTMKAVVTNSTNNRA
jgi:hypothetical protein